jgi:hypothetical protein
MVPYLVIGYLYVSHLFRLKENSKRLDLLFVEERNHNFGPKKIAAGFSRMLKKITRKQDK